MTFLTPEYQYSYPETRFTKSSGGPFLDPKHDYECRSYMTTNVADDYPCRSYRTGNVGPNLPNVRLLSPGFYTHRSWMHSIPLEPEPDRPHRWPSEPFGKIEQFWKNRKFWKKLTFWKNSKHQIANIKQQIANSKQRIAGSMQQTADSRQRKSNSEKQRANRKRQIANSK